MRVYLLDDQTTMLELIHKETKNILTERGYEADFDCYEDFSDDHDLSQYDLFILDIELRDGKSGFDVAKKITDRYPDAIIIFCSGHDDLVFSSFRLNVFYFVRKIHLSKELGEAMDKYLKLAALRRTEYQFLSSEYSVNVMSIKYVVGIGHRATFHFKTDKEMMERQPLSKIMEQFPDKLFVQVDRNVVVNVAYIEDLRRNKVLMKDGKEFRISRRRIDDVTQRFVLYKTM